MKQKSSTRHQNNWKKYGHIRRQITASLAGQTRPLPPAYQSQHEARIQAEEKRVEAAIKRLKARGVNYL